MIETHCMCSNKLNGTNKRVEIFEILHAFKESIESESQSLLLPKLCKKLINCISIEIKPQKLQISLYQRSLADFSIINLKPHTNKMYGLLLVNMQQYVEKVFGAKKWIEVKEGMKIKVIFNHQSFVKFLLIILHLSYVFFLHLRRKTSLTLMKPTQKASL